jgi:hypothetical protein
MYIPSPGFQRSDGIIFTPDPFSICPICESEVPESLCDSEYKKRIRHAIRTEEAAPELLWLISLSVLFQHGPRSGRDDLFDKILRALQRKYPDKTLRELINAGNRLWEFIDKTIFS